MPTDRSYRLDSLRPAMSARLAMVLCTLSVLAGVPCAWADSHSTNATPSASVAGRSSSFPKDQAAVTLSLDQALRLAEEQHPRLKAGEAFLESAAAAVRSARAFPNPEIGALAGTQTYRIPGNAAGAIYSFSILQPLDFGSVRSSRIQLADRGRQTALAAVALTRLEILSGVRRAFFQVLRKQAEIDLLTENLRLVEDLRQRIQVRVGVGEAGRLELVRADAELATARTAANAARVELVAAISQLRGAVGSALPSDLRTSGEFESAVPLAPVATLRQEALERHPALDLARAERSRAEVRLRHERSLRIPMPALRAEIDRPPDTPTYRFGLNFPLPLWDRRRGQVAEASALLEQAEALLESREMEIAAAVEGAIGRYQTTGQQLDAFEQGLIREAEAALKAAEVAYQLGERGILEVLDAQRVLRTVRLQFLNARHDRQQALIDLNELRAIELKRAPQPGTRPAPRGTP